MLRAAFVIVLLCTAAALAGQSIIVRRIDITGIHRTRRWVVARELRFDVGDTITNKDLIGARDRLSNLNLFNSVTVKATRDGIVSVRAPELWPLWPVLGVSFSEGHFSDLFTRPKGFLKHATLSVGGTYTNVLGTGAGLYGVGEIGASEGVDAEYHSRWVSATVPLSLRVGFTDIRQTNTAPVSYDSTRYLRDIVYTVDASTHEGAPTRVGLKLKYRELHVQTGISHDLFVEDQKRYKTWWFSPYLILDRRNLEWYPTRGAYGEVRLDLVTGNTKFIISTYDVRGYFPLTESDRPPLLALRLVTGTSADATPKWAHFYYSFSNALRGFSDLGSESADYIIGNVELRYPLGSESTYNVPLIGRYGKGWPWGVSAVTFLERGELSLAGRRSERTGYGGGFYFRVPYFEILETSMTLRPSGHVSFNVSTSVAF